MPSNYKPSARRPDYRRNSAADDDYIWGDKMPDYVAEAKTKGFQPEILSAQTSGDQIEIRVSLSSRDTQTFAQICGDFQTTKTNIDATYSA